MKIGTIYIKLINNEVLSDDFWDYMTEPRGVKWYRLENGRTIRTDAIFYYWIERDQ